MEIPEGRLWGSEAMVDLWSILFLKQPSRNMIMWGEHGLKATARLRRLLAKVYIG